MIISQNATILVFSNNKWYNLHKNRLNSAKNYITIKLSAGTFFGGNMELKSKIRIQM